MGSIEKLANWLFPARATAPVPHQIPYRSDIDGLRAFAVLAVVIYHVAPSNVPGGFVGVDIFFVISGMLITSLILDAARKERFSYAEFYGRRVRRLLPALLLVLIAVLAVGWFFLLPREYIALNKVALSSVGFVPNLRLWWEAGYFEGDPKTRVLLHLWSLGVEEQFYLIWPAIILLFWRRRLVVATVALGLMSFAACVALSYSKSALAFYWPLMRFWELLAGCALAYRSGRASEVEIGAATRNGGWTPEALSWIGFAMLCCAVLLMDGTKPYPGWRTLFPVLGAVLVIAAGPHTIINRLVFGNRIAVWLGQISYPLYLWHWPVFSLWWVLPGGPAALKGTVVVSVMLAAATYELVEKPIRRLKAGPARTWTTRILIAFLVMVGLFSASTLYWRGLPGRFPASVKAFLTYSYEDDRWSKKCFIVDGQAIGDWSRNACISGAKEWPLLVVWGDSHAAELWPDLEPIAQRRHFRLGKMIGGGCPPVLVSVKENRSCLGFNRFYFSEIQRLKPAIAVLSGYWNGYEIGYGPLESTIGSLKKAGVARVVVVGPTTRWRGYLPEMVARDAIVHSGRIASSFGEDGYVPIPEDGLKNLVKRSGAEYISASDILCPKGRCWSVLGRGPEGVTYYDESHLSAAGAKYLVDRIQGKIFPAR